MKKMDHRRQFVLFMISLIVVILQTAIFAYVWLRIYNVYDVTQRFYNRGNYALIAFYLVLCIIIYKLFGCFHVGYRKVYDILFEQIGALLTLNSLTYLQLCLTCRWRFFTHIGPMLIMTAVDFGVLVIWALISRTIYAKFSPPRELLLIYGKYSPDDLMHKLDSQKEKYHIQEAISIDTDIDIIKEKITQHKAIVMTDIPCEIRNKLLKFCFEKDIRCYSVPKISDIMVINSAKVDLFDTSLLLFRNNGLSWGQQIGKRIFDIVVSLIGLILASPIMLVIALCIKLCDRGPVFFTQDRLTQDGKPFKILKFRSMYVESTESGYCMTRKNDSRVTPVGKIIRNIHFDELPQLINILKGDMSIVGPRPECPELTEQYSQIVPEFRFRLKVKAGLTGYAQVYGKYNTKPYDKLKMDLTYIERYSFLLDLQMIVMTIKILFQKENTEGIEQWQTSAAATNLPEEVATK